MSTPYTPTMIGFDLAGEQDATAWWSRTPDGKVVVTSPTIRCGRLPDSMQLLRQQMHGGTEMEAAAERAMLDQIAYGTGMWKQGFARAIHIAAATIYKPATPAEIDAYVQGLVDDDITTSMRGTWRVRPLVAALRRIYP